MKNIFLLYKNLKKNMLKQKKILKEIFPKRFFEVLQDMKIFYKISDFLLIIFKKVDLIHDDLIFFLDFHFHILKIRFLSFVSQTQEFFQICEKFRNILASENLFFLFFHFSSNKLDFL